MASSSSTIASSSKSVITNREEKENCPVEKKKIKFSALTPATSLTNIYGRIRTQFLNSQEEWVNVELIDESPSTKSQPLPSTWSPPEGVLKSVFDAIKAHLIAKHGYSPDAKDETMESSPEFMNLMKQWGERLTWKTASIERKATPIPIFHDGKKVGVKFQDGVLRFKFFKDGEQFGWRQALAKCQVQKCWKMAQIGVYCTGHKNHLNLKREVLLIRDINNKVESVIALLHPPTRTARFKDSSVQLYMQGAVFQHGYPTITSYINSRPKINDPDDVKPADWDDEKNGEWQQKQIIDPKTKAIFVIQKSWQLEPELSDGHFHTIAIALSMMTVLHNSIAEDNNKINFVHGWIEFAGFDGEKVLELLKLNGFSFNFGKLEKEMKVSPLIPPSFSKPLPYTYLGRYNGGHYDGHRYSRSGIKGIASDGHARVKKSGMQNVPEENQMVVYQMARIDDEKEMDKRAREVEYLQLISTLVAKMEELEDHNGNQIHPLTQKLFHFSKVNDIALLNQVFKFKFSRALEIKKKVIDIVKGKVILNGIESL